MFRQIPVFFLLIFAAALPTRAQETRPQGHDGKKSKISILAARKKWYDRLAKPIRIEAHTATYGELPRLKMNVGIGAIGDDPERFLDRDIRLAGRLTKVCPTKGCWIRVLSDGRELFVKFKGYSFFIPRQAAGLDIVLEGRVKLDIPSEKMRKHFEEEALHPEKKQKLNFEAYSVVITEASRKPWELGTAGPLLAYPDHAVYGAWPEIEESTPIAKAATGDVLRLEGEIRATGEDSTTRKFGLTDGKTTITVALSGKRLSIPRKLSGHRACVEGQIEKSVDGAAPVLKARSVTVFLKKKPDSRPATKRPSK